VRARGASERPRIEGQFESLELGLGYTASLRVHVRAGLAPHGFPPLSRSFSLALFLSTCYDAGDRPDGMVNRAFTRPYSPSEINRGSAIQSRQNITLTFPVAPFTGDVSFRLR